MSQKCGIGLSFVCVWNVTWILSTGIAEIPDKITVMVD